MITGGRSCWVVSLDAVVELVAGRFGRVERPAASALTCGVCWRGGSARTPQGYPVMVLVVSLGRAGRVVAVVCPARSAGHGEVAHEGHCTGGVVAAVALASAVAQDVPRLHVRQGVFDFGPDPAVDRVEVFLPAGQRAAVAGLAVRHDSRCPGSRRRPSPPPRRSDGRCQTLRRRGSRCGCPATAVPPPPAGCGHR